MIIFHLDAAISSITQFLLKYFFHPKHQVNIILLLNILAFLRNITDTTATDNELVQSYRQTGNLDILGQLYSRYMDLVYGLCLKYMEDPEFARDAVMQIFEELVEKLKKHKVEYFKSWLYALAKNHCLMQLRSGKSKKTIALPPELMQSEENLHLNGSLHKEAQFELMKKCLEKLTQEQQLTVILFYLEEKSYNEIVLHTGMEWNKVRSLIQNGRRNLKICMDKNS
ncbi:RNA polymerase sigma factor [Flavihumibacter profundi]|jgi:RNA polymerase sigma factor (sigma-70 family)|uniref:RNA polymerase sigma factor n=1 Tax=Flavihumibacter profundi TaxID=2716883 RepID=UPI001CC63FB4|nr:sigma-70 family RNA polymerase sigma factor [Flavihumibacter profundi]MBZ5857023.1 sigma-70 family RNA polymerase sigma factor [Flavihumibacter profundi]